MGAGGISCSELWFGCAFMDPGQALSALDAGTVVAALAIFTIAAIGTRSTVCTIAAVVTGSTICAVGAWEISDVERLTESLSRSHAQLLHETQFLQPRQLTQLSLPSLSGGMVAVSGPCNRLESQGENWGPEGQVGYLPNDISLAGLLHVR